MSDEEVIAAFYEDGHKSDLIKEFYDMNKLAFFKFAKSYYSIENDLITAIYQDAYYIMYTNFVDGRVKKLNCKLQTYLFSIGKNLILNELKRKGKLTSILLSDTWDTKPDIDIIEEENDRTLKLSMVRDAVISLKDPCKTILTMFYWGKKKLIEINEELPKYKKVETLKTQKSKCMKRLEKILKEQFSALNIAV